ncbi:MAG: alginate export family protein [Bryobacteraceae bacterium]
MLQLERLLSGCAAAILLSALCVAKAAGPAWDAPARVSGWVSGRTDGRLLISAESRGRYERRTGQAFGNELDLSATLYRNRLSVSVTPARWLKLSGAVQDSRAPGYGANAPSSARDQADLLEGYLELFSNRKQGFGMTAGRMLLAYGETRLIASSQWGNVIRGFDGVRTSWRSNRATLEALWFSPVKARVGEFNRPVPGERLWGTYNVFPNLFGTHLAEAYVLRHDQNAPAGFTGGNRAAGTDRLGITTLGGRLAGPLPHGLEYSLEGVLQRGKVESASQRGAAWFSALSRRWMVSGKPLDLTGEYKYASGTRDPEDATRAGTFDALFPSAHDKFGHMDLFGWRNIHSAQSVVTFGVSAAFSVNFMYNSWWLASARDALYSSAGRALARSADGSAGRHIGQETDVFATYRYRRFTFGAGYGRLFKGEFIRKATPGVEPTYLYVFHTYTM